MPSSIDHDMAKGHGKKQSQQKHRPRLQQISRISLDQSANDEDRSQRITQKREPDRQGNRLLLTRLPDNSSRRLGERMSLKEDSELFPFFGLKMFRQKNIIRCQLLQLVKRVR